MFSISANFAGSARDKRRNSKPFAIRLKVKGTRHEVRGAKSEEKGVRKGELCGLCERQKESP
jgi:hypothetical protein